LVALILGQSWLVFYDDFTVVDIDECLKICYALYALDSYEINLISLDKFFPIPHVFFISTVLKRQ
jgi:hypothetical protein